MSHNHSLKHSYFLSSPVRLGLVLVLLMTTLGILPAPVARAATFTITNTDDSGVGSLRQAIIDAESNGEADIIDLSGISGTITLASALPTITQDLTITGPGADVLAVSGADTYRVFEITGGTVTISGLTITEGHAHTALVAFSYSGGGLYIGSSADVTLRDCAITDNTLPPPSGEPYPMGAGIFSAGDLTLERCTVSGNDAADSYGGGMFIFAPSTSHITASTISGNSADTGAGIYANGAEVDINGATVTNNTAATDDGGITVDADGVITLTNSIVAGNIDSDDTDYYPDVDEFWGDINSGGYNIIGIDDDGFISGDGATGDQVGTSGSPLDPRLGPLADNSGRTQTHALLAGSPALDAIPEGGDGYNGASATDQRGFPRPQGANCDVGAYEWEHFIVTGIEPARNALDAPLDSTVVVTYTQPVSATTVTSRTVAVHSMMQGLITATHSTADNVVTVTPNREFFPGELVYAVATTQTANITGTHPLTPTLWQFNAGEITNRCVEGFDDISAALTGVEQGSVAWGDYDGDVDLDILLTGDTGSTYVTEVWRNDGGGSFSQASSAPTGVSWSDAAWGDYDNDGDLDILLAGYTGSTQVTEVWRNDGGGSFTAAITDTLTGVYNSSVAWGDYDNDGDLDVLLAGYNGSTPVTEVWRNNGGSSFSRASTAPTGVYYGGVAWGDYDNDGDLDILLSGQNSDGDPVTEVWRNDGGGSFSQASTAPTGVNYSSVAWGDYDNDGDLDILLAGENNSSAAVTEVWRNDGGGSFSQASTAPTGVYYSSIAWGDYDNDGDLDILLAGYDSGGVPVTEVWRNDGGGSFSQASTAPTDVVYGSGAWGDYDNDGDLDILLAGHNSSGDPVTEVWRNEDCLPDLSIVKTVTPSTAAPGGTITYTLTFFNAGGVTATGVVITDSVPVSVTSPTVIGSSGAAITLTGSAPHFVWSVANLAPGQGGVITLTGVLSEPLAAGVFTNTAEIACAETEGDETNNSSDAPLTVHNVAPVADAGNNQTVLISTNVTLDGSASSDANGDALTYGWAQTGGPSVTLSDASAISPTFTALGSETVLTFTLIITDSHGLADSTPDEVVVTVTSNLPPIADAGDDQSVTAGTTVTLDGSASADPDGHTPLTYGWAQTGGTMVSFNATLSRTTFTAPPAADVLTFTLTVTDSHGLADDTPDEVVITVSEVITHYAYLPLLARNYIAAPDLVVQSVTATRDSVQVVIENQGSAPVTGEFWVDVYINPNPAPTGVNQLWPGLADEGLVWGVKAAALPLAPGDVLTLTVGDAYYVPEYSQVAWPLAEGTPVYAQVDSWNAVTTYGAVLESHEITGGAYNNISSSTSTAGLAGEPYRWW